MPPPQCSLCRFFVLLEGQQVLDDGLTSPSAPDWGECRAQPPLAPWRDAAGNQPRLAARWPVVRRDHWCGSWEEKSWSDA